MPLQVLIPPEPRIVLGGHIRAFRIPIAPRATRFTFHRPLPVARFRGVVVKLSLRRVRSCYRVADVDDQPAQLIAFLEAGSTSVFPHAAVQVGH